MQASNEHAVKVLNSLIETTLDSANGYKDAAEHTENAQFRTMFSERSSKRRELGQRLMDEVRSFGGEPQHDQSMLGKAHNKFTELKAKVTGDSDKSVIDEVERGEDVIKAKFEQATRDEELPEPVRQMVTTCYASIKSDHDDISRLKHQLH